MGMEVLINMNIFDVIGPIMIGPSSSHTAGAARLGKMARIILGESPTDVKIILYGSFAETGKGHGTDLAIIAGLLGLDPWDERLKLSFEIAKKEGLNFSFSREKLKKGMHPNSVRFILQGRKGNKEIEGASIGGGKIKITNIDGFPVSFTGEYPTIVNIYKDRIGVISKVTEILAQKNINIARMRVSRDRKMGTALMIIETDQVPPQTIKKEIEALPYITSSIYISGLNL